MNQFIQTYLDHVLAKLLIKQSIEVIILLDNKFKVVLFNPMAEKVFNCSADKVIGEKFDIICSQYKIDNFLKVKKDKIQSNAITSDIFTTINNIKLSWTVSHVDPMNDLSFLLKAMPYEAKESQDEIIRLETLIENMPCNVYWMDKNCIMVGCNRNVLSMLNMTQDEYVGKTYEELSELCHWPEGLAQKLKNDDLTVLRTGLPIFGIEDPPLPHATSNALNLLTSRVPIRNNEGEIIGVAGISVDITNRKKIEQALKEEKENAIKAKTEFLENMRHDIRTPLTGIVGFSEIIKNEVTDPKIKEYADNLIASSYALLDLLNGVLEAIKVSSGEIPLLKKKFSLQGKLNDVILLNQAKARQKNIELLFKYDSAIPNYLIGDSTRIHRIVLELVTNALNFTNHGQVKLSGHLAKDDGNDAIVKIVVEDTGIGIEREKQHEIYVQFKRLTPSYEGIYKGYGLGLSIVKQFIDELQGELYIESQVGVGSKFTFIIKLKKPLLDEELGSEDILLLSNSNKIIPATEVKLLENNISSDTESFESCILVVEDNAIAASIVTNMLSDMNCKVDVADKGRLAVDFAKQKQYDLIFMDIGLPDMDGYEVTKRIRLNELNKEHVPIIALTAHVDEENKKHCIGIGMNAVLSKPLVKEKAEDILNSFVSYRRDKLKVEASNTPEESTPKVESPVFDFELIERQFGKKVALEMVAMLVDSFPDELKHLHAAYQKSDWPSIQSLTHKLKGGVSYCGALRLEEACFQLESCIRAGKNELATDFYNHLLHEISLAEEAMKKRLH